MRYLKNKVMRAMEAGKNKLEASSIYSFDDIEAASTIIFASSPKEVKNSKIKNKDQSSINKRANKRCRDFSSTGKPRRPPSSTKNISINFGKAIASFAASHLALPYMEPFLQKKTFTYVEFIKFANNGKEKVGSIDTFKNLIMVQISDDSKQIALKETFKALAEVFIKYFSVNWIFHGKVTHKLVYLKYRLKMLRRVQNPEKFTYVKKCGGTRRKNKSAIKNNYAEV